MTPLTVVTFKWKTPGYRAVFESKHVNILRRMVLRHYPDPVRFVCFTDVTGRREWRFKVTAGLNDGQ